MEELQAIAKKIEGLEMENAQLRKTIDNIDLNAKSLTKADQRKIKTAFDKMDGIKALLIEKGLYQLEEEQEVQEEQVQEEVVTTPQTILDDPTPVGTENEFTQAGKLDELYKRQHMILLADTLTQEERAELAKIEQEIQEIEDENLFDEAPVAIASEFEEA